MGDENPKDPNPIRTMDEILRLRAVVARYGEQDQNAWWNHEILAQGGGSFVAQRLFPRTHEWVSIELALAALRVRDEDRLTRRAAYTLFRFAPIHERSLELRLREHKTAGTPPATVLGVNLGDESLPSLSDALALGQLVSAMTAEAEGSDDLVCIGESETPKQGDWATLRKLATDLAGSYTVMAKGDQRLPYIRIRDGGDS